MVELNYCPVCNSQSLKVIKRHLFHPTTRTISQDIPSDVSNLEERLWIYFNKLDIRSGPRLVQSMQCQNCDFIFSNPRFTESDTKLKYETIDQLGFDQQRHTKKGMPAFHKRSMRIEQLIQSTLPKALQNKKLSILDYGGAEGYLLKPFLDQGHRTFLVDYIQYVNSPAGVQYLGKDIADIDPSMKFDLIMVLHTLEHVVNPVQLIEDLKPFLSDDGLIYIEVPLGAWLEWEFLKEPVTHINFFSESSLDFLVKKIGLVPIFLNSQWQWVVTQQKPCINLIASTKQPKQPLRPKSIAHQMNSLSYYRGSIKNNFKYYSKLVVYHLLNRIGFNLK